MNAFLFTLAVILKVHICTEFGYYEIFAWWIFIRVEFFHSPVSQPIRVEFRGARFNIGNTLKKKLLNQQNLDLQDKKIQILVNNSHKDIQLQTKQNLHCGNQLTYRMLILFFCNRSPYLKVIVVSGIRSETYEKKRELYYLFKQAMTSLLCSQQSYFVKWLVRGCTTSAATQ